MKTMLAKVFLLATLLLAGGWMGRNGTAAAETADLQNLKMQFDFTNVSGTSVTDPVSGITAKLVNNAKVTAMGKYHVLSLGSDNGYLDMTSKAGELVRNLQDFTVSVYYRVEETAVINGAGNFVWCFSQSAANTQYDAPYTAYRINAQRMATSTGGWSKETGLEMSSESPKGCWMHVLYRQKNQKGELYINGKLVKTNNNMPLLKNAFTAVPAYNWIGRPPFASDVYLKQTSIADFRLYDVAVSDETVTTLAAELPELEDQFAHGTGGDNTALTNTLEQARQLLADAADYPAGAVVMLEDAINIAQGVADEDHTQYVYDNQETELKEILSIYTAAKGVLFDVSGITEAYDTDRGFVHPGGMHTQADFDRIKRQLEEGNPTVSKAYEVLKHAEYAQSGVATWPVEVIRRGGDGQNYINAARGATMAYQNALRWKIEGTKANADAAVRILMAWAKTCKLVSGDSNWALAAGLYGYAFAQAAELMRDYEGWKREDFEQFKHWMLTVWYPGNINFLRGRNGTWENWVGNQGGYRPGHYWSNWPLCNALSAITIGILCDDVFIYNQGLSFLKYDQCGTFVDPRVTDPILNDGCTEFIGNLIVTTSESSLETGAYGKLGQMQESGRDGGHAAMALGLAVDICKTAWNQGDDLFSYMDNRMAAGVEFTAACTQNVQGLPWTNYKYVDCRTAWHNGWLMTGPAEPAEVRNYWGTVIGHYEGVKGVKMPYAERAYKTMTANGPDAGGTGGASGAYDHLGYSVLMNTYDTQFCPEDKRPTLLSPKMYYEGDTICHNELGGLKNHFSVTSTECVPAGKTVKLMPQLPEGEEDTGNWKWNTGETTRDLTVTTDKSFLYRVTYTNANGIESQQVFAIASEGDCNPSPARCAIYANGVWVGDSIATVFYGDKVTLHAGDAAGWNTSIVWDNGQQESDISVGNIASDRHHQAIVTNQGGRKETVNFHIFVRTLRQEIDLDGETLLDSAFILTEAGKEVILRAYVPTSVPNVTYLWSDGSTDAELNLGQVEISGVYTVDVNVNGSLHHLEYEVLVKDADNTYRLPAGNYLLRHVKTDTYMTSYGENQMVRFEKGDNNNPIPSQIWKIDSKIHYSFQCVADNMGLTTLGTTAPYVVKLFSLDAAKGINRYALSVQVGAKCQYWDLDAAGELDLKASSELTYYPFELIPVDVTAIQETIIDGVSADDPMYDLSGRRVQGYPKKGFYLSKGRKSVITDSGIKY